MLDPRAFLINSKTGRVVAATFIEFLSGNSTNPSICFTDSPDSGLQCDNAGAVNYVKNGINLGELGTASSLIGGSDTQIQFNDSGSFGGSVDLTWDDTGKQLSVGGDINSQNVETTGVFSAAGGAAATPSITFTGDLNTGIYSPGADQVAISTSGTERVEFGTSEVVFNDGRANYDFRIEGDTEANLFFVDASTDRVGLGTSTPQGRFHLASLGIVAEPTYDVSGAFPGIVLSSWNRNFGSNFEAVGDIIVWSDKQGASRPSQLRFFTAPNSPNAIPSQRMVIDSAGRVGIGTTSPEVNLDTTIDSAVEWTSGSNLSNAANLPFVGLSVKNEDTSITGTESSLLIQAGGSGSAMHSLTVKRTGNNTGDLIFRRRASTASAESMRIDSSGRLLIGTSSTSLPTGIQIQGYAGGSTGQGILTLSRGSALPIANTTIGDIRFYDNGSGFGAKIEAETDGPWASSDYPGRLVFSVTSDGSASPTEALRITNDRYVRLASGSGGIQFNGDTAAANALDDYEEGTWTPAYEPETNSFTSITYRDQAGSYTKIGNRVFFQGRIRTSALTVGTASGIVNISGLPFASVNDSASGRNAGSISFASGFGGDTPSSLAVEINATEFLLYYRTTSNGPTANLDVSDLGAGSTGNALFFSGCYTVA